MSKLKIQPNNRTQLMNICIIEAGMTYEDDYDIRDIINDVIEKPDFEEKTRKHGCFVECILRKLNWERPNLKMKKEQEELAGLLRNISHECEKSFSLIVCAIKVAREEHEEYVIKKIQEEAETK
ncbi:PREDICTED: uncharacterized protein LOC105618368 [Atta cephalotes]|uniref:Uncharacterized protein n=1 Tax=Atta cephalotes TaxID=12957 RepID=A0A158NCP6_ATTCE|nr:PREDICTED: uncharacterized protein LOC105618368 [Atta cephalotes]